MKILKISEPKNLYARFAEEKKWYSNFTQEQLDDNVEKIEHLVKSYDAKIHYIIFFQDKEDVEEHRQNQYIGIYYMLEEHIAMGSIDLTEQTPLEEQTRFLRILSK